MDLSSADVSCLYVLDLTNCSLVLNLLGAASHKNSGNGAVKTSLETGKKHEK